MGFLGASVVVVAMVVVALSLGALGFLVLRFDLPTSAIFAAAAFSVMVALQFLSWRRSDRRATDRDLAVLARTLQTLTRDLALVTNRVSAIEAAGAGAARQDIAALRNDLGVLRADVDDLFAHAGGAAVPPPPPEPPRLSAAPKAAEEPQRRGRYGALTREERGALLADALAAGRLDILLQPIVTLPQRKIRWYDVHLQVKTERGDILLPEDVQAIASEAKLAGRLDEAVVFRAVQLVRRLQVRNREVGLVVPLSAELLAGADGFRGVADFLGANGAIAASIVFAVPQEAYRRFGAIEFEAMQAMAKLGFRFCLGEARDIRLDARDLADRAFRFVKVPADVLLGRDGRPAGDIHPADLADLLSRYGVDLVADRIETEATVVDILDFDVRFGQGHLFSPPRPVRADILGDLAPERRAVAS